ncbi:tetraspanin 37 isoform X2 [Oncorhynchus keta]|uniref:tetraspanin 37 isoform X2 n=1 Tax=Oncorhynchus keta TaxID=8018 RepID=UPI0015FAD713|nr:tetraspanin 37 isoform X2 [Oncorhynchus keta]
MGGRSGGRSEWYVPVVELQTQWHLLHPHIHHPPSMPSSGQRYSPIGQWRTGHLGVPQKVSLAAGRAHASSTVWDTAYMLPWFWAFQFVYLLVVVFCLEATAAALAYVNTGKVDSELAPFSSVFQRYTGRCQDPYSDAVDATQKELQCCGIYDYRDWLATPWFNHSGRGSVPHSCCNYTYHTCNGTLELPGLLYPKGCQVKLEEALLFVLHLIIWSSLAVVLVETVGFVSVAQLMRDQPLLEYGILDREYGILDREYGILDREWA